MDNLIVGNYSKCFTCGEIIEQGEIYCSEECSKRTPFEATAKAEGTKTRQDLVEWIETMHRQNTSGREAPDEMFRLGIEAAIEEALKLQLFSIKAHIFLERTQHQDK